MPENSSKFTIQIIVLRLLCWLHNHNQTIIRCLLSAFEYAIFSEYENIPSPMTTSAPIIQKPLNDQSRKPVPLLLTLNKNSITGKGIIPLARTHDFSKIYPSLPHDTCTYQRGKKCWIFAKFWVDTECVIFNAFNPLLCNIVKWSDTL